MRSKILFLFLLVILLICEVFHDTHAQEKCAGSNHPTVVEICKELEKAERPDRISRTEFKYENPRSDVSIIIEPKDAFTVEKLPSPRGSSFLIKIIKPQLLFRPEGGLTFPVRVIIGEFTGAAPPIRIDADSRCETILEFRQAGEPLNLETVGSRFKLEWIYPANLLSGPEVLGTQVRVRRLGKGEATLTLIVRDGTVEVARATRSVLDCTDLPPTTPSSTESIVELMMPTQCFRPAGQRRLSIRSGMRYYYTLENVCSRPIRCSWDSAVQHYTSAKDSEDDIRDDGNRYERESGERRFSQTIPGRTGNKNGRITGSFDVVSDLVIRGERSRNYRHNLTTADCEWDQ